MTDSSKHQDKKQSTHINDSNNRRQAIRQQNRIQDPQAVAAIQRRLERIKQLEKMDSTDQVEKSFHHRQPQKSTQRTQSSLNTHTMKNRSSKPDLAEQDKLNRQAAIQKKITQSHRNAQSKAEIESDERLFQKAQANQRMPKITIQKAQNSDKDPKNQASYQSEDAILNSTEPSKNPSTNKHTRHSNKHTHSDKKAAKDERYSLKDLSTEEKVAFTFSVATNLIKRFFVFILVAGILVAGLGGGVGLGYFASLVKDTQPPSRDEIASALNRIEQQSTLYYASKEPIADVRSDVVRSVAKLDDISPYIKEGLISIEDQNFYDHPGVNPKSTLRAILQTLLSGTGTGGSTLTQQLVKQQLLTNDVTFFRKANEILLALRVEKYFSKDEILASYLNVSPFGRNNKGENIAGIQEAAEGIFGKKPSEVNLNQAAFLVGLPQSPYSYTPYDQYGHMRKDHSAGIQRMKDVLFAMYRNQVIDKASYEEALKYDITKDFIATKARIPERQSYLYQTVMNQAIEQIIALNVKKDGNQLEKVHEDAEWYQSYYQEAEQELRTSGYQVYTTIEKDIYDQMQQTAAAYKDQLGASFDGVYTDPTTGEETYFVEKVQTGVVAIDNATGRVLGFVAGTDYENNQIDHAFGMHRSPGSTIKPLAVYGPAIENNIITPASIIPDTAFTETYNDGSQWSPTNYGNQISNQFYPARQSLAWSYNIPTIRIYQEMRNQGVPVFDYLQRMGFDTQHSYTETDVQNLAFSIGGVNKGPTVFEQTSAFSTFANGGTYAKGHIIDEIKDATGKTLFKADDEPVRVFSEDSNYLMVDMLRDVNNLGTGQIAKSKLTTGGDWIAKTGTSENGKDLWYIGATPKITIGAWMGYDNQYQEFVFNLNDGFGSEAQRSQSFWAQIVNDLFAIRPDIIGADQSFQQPNSVIRMTVMEKTGTQPGNIQMGGQVLQVASGLKEELFKASYPAPILTEHFMINASPSDYQLFWGNFMRQIQTEKESDDNESKKEGEAEDETGETSSSENPEQEIPDNTQAPAETSASY
ncbi:MAG: transglycosylase domain-containing protein [Facklamia hominis]